MPQLPLETNEVVPSFSVIASSETRMSDAPTPQFAPVATGGSARPSKTAVRSPGSSPIIVRPAVSNEHVATYGTPTAMAALAAARTSSGADIVSIHATSAPPATSASISSPNVSSASASVSSPSGSKSDPVGPTDPATTTGRSAASATSPASSA